jgi:hypothetical protein
MTARVAAANHLGHLLTSGPARQDLTDHSALAEQLVRWRTAWADARFADPIAKGGKPGYLTDYQTGFYDMARLLRQAGLPAAHP